MKTLQFSLAGIIVAACVSNARTEELYETWLKGLSGNWTVKVQRWQDGKWEDQTTGNRTARMTASGAVFVEISWDDGTSESNLFGYNSETKSLEMKKTELSLNAATDAAKKVELEKALVKMKAEEKKLMQKIEEVKNAEENGKEIKKAKKIKK